MVHPEIVLLHHTGNGQVGQRTHIVVLAPVAQENLLGPGTDDIHQSIFPLLIGEVALVTQNPLLQRPGVRAHPEHLRVVVAFHQVGIRIPDNVIIRTLVKELGNPILTMSIHDQDDLIEYTTDPELIHEKYENEVNLVIDGGYGGLEPSTVVSYTDPEPVIIRQGKGVLDY